jgi:DNA modification methylase
MHVYKDVCGRCGARRIDSQIGLEPTPEAYVADLVEVFREVKRVLRNDGVLWLNLGDSYCGSWGNYGGQNRGAGRQRQIINGSQVPNPAYDGHENWRPPTTDVPGLKSKDLVGIPWMVAFALRADGWYLRSDIIWNKPNPMPESVTDRCTKSHEYIFMLTKSERYYFDSAAIAEPTTVDVEAIRVYNEYYGHTKESRTDAGSKSPVQRKREWQGEEGGIFDIGRDETGEGEVAQVSSGTGSIGQISEVRETQGGVEEILRGRKGQGGYEEISNDRQGEGEFVEGCSQSQDEDATGSVRPNGCAVEGDTRETESSVCDMREGIATDKRSHCSTKSRRSAYCNEYSGALPELQQSEGQQITTRNKRDVWTVATQPCAEAHFATFPPKLIEPMILAGSKASDTILDPFMGSGTTAIQAVRLHRHYLGCELNPEYVAMANRRIADMVGPLFERTP